MASEPSISKKRSYNFGRTTPPPLYQNIKEVINGSGSRPMGDRAHDFSGSTYSIPRPSYFYTPHADENYLANTHPAQVLQQKAGNQALPIDGCARDGVPPQGAYVNGTSVPPSINSPLTLNPRNSLIPMNPPLPTGRGGLAPAFPYQFSAGARNLGMESNTPSTVGEVPTSTNLPLPPQRGQDVEIEGDMKRDMKRQMSCTEGWREGQDVLNSAESFERRVSKRGKISPMALVILVFPDGTIDLSHDTLKPSSHSETNAISDKTRKIYNYFLTSLKADMHDWSRNSAFVECTSLMSEQNDPLQTPEGISIPASMPSMPIPPQSRRKTKLNESRSLKEEAQRIVPDLKIRQSEWCTDKAECVKKNNNHKCGPKRVEVGWPNSLPFVHPARFNKEECKKILEWWRQRSATKADAGIFRKPKLV